MADTRRIPLTDEELLSLPVDSLGLQLLKFFHTTGGDYLNRSSIANSQTIEWATGIARPNIRVIHAVSEAYDWLLLQGLVAKKPEDNTEWSYVTARGQTIANDLNPHQRVLAFQRINVDLHASIADRIRSQFLLGEYESAVLLAFREVEIRVRNLGNYPASTIGVNLMRQAFNPQTGNLTDPNLDPGEKSATSDLFAGVIGAFKNPSSHRQVDYGDVTVASEAVLLADLLLRILDQYDTRLNANQAVTTT